MTPAASTIIRVVGGWNEAKSAAGLETTPGRGPRVAAKPAEVDLPEGREWEDLTQDQRWHYKHTEWNTQRTLERRQRHREWLNQLKRQSGGCRDCEVSDPTCLDFHHVEPAKKTMAVNELVLYGYSKERIREELDTCVFLCANCHRIEHANRSPLPDDAPLEARLQPDDKPQTREAIRNWTRRFRASLGCADCGEKDVRCLMFHHENPSTKRDGVAALIAQGIGFESIRDEVDKCVVLCANWHRRRHSQSSPDCPESDSV